MWQRPHTEPTIVRARNELARVLSLDGARFCDVPQYVREQLPGGIYGGSEFLRELDDHLELYKTSTAYLAVFSPYKPKAFYTEELLDLLERAGFYLHRNLYNNMATTFVKLNPTGYVRGPRALPLVRKAHRQLRMDNGMDQWRMRGMSDDEKKQKMLEMLDAVSTLHQIVAVQCLPAPSLHYLERVAADERRTVCWLRRRDLVRGVYLAKQQRAHVVNDPLIDGLVRLPGPLIRLVLRHY